MAPLREREKEIRAAMADAEQLCREKQAEKRESGALGSSKAGSPANRQLEDDLAAQKAVWKYLRKRAKTAGIPQQNVETFGGDEGGNQDGLVALLVATERRTELWSERVADDQLTPAEMDQLFALNQAGDADDLLTPLQLQKLKPNRARELLMSRGIWSRVSVIEHHYYHFDEVWHAVYNRAERRHLNGAFCATFAALPPSLIRWFLRRPGEFGLQGRPVEGAPGQPLQEHHGPPTPRALGLGVCGLRSAVGCTCCCAGVDGA